MGHSHFEQTRTDSRFRELPHEAKAFATISVIFPSKSSETSLKIPATLVSHKRVAKQADMPMRQQAAIGRVTIELSIAFVLTFGRKLVCGEYTEN